MPAAATPPGSARPSGRPNEANLLVRQAPCEIQAPVVSHWKMTILSSWSCSTAIFRFRPVGTYLLKSILSKRRSWILVFSRKERKDRKAYRDGGVLQDFQAHPLF